MKTHSFMSVALSLCSFTVAAAAESRTVTDYFLQMPSRYFQVLDNGEVTPSVRTALLQESFAIVDLPNGYIRTSSPYPDLCNYEMAIFRRAQGAHLVALNVRCTVGDSLVIADPDRNWRDVTAEVFPLDVQNERFLTVNLPRHGRTVTVARDEGGETRVTFDGQRFRAE